MIADMLDATPRDVPDVAFAHASERRALDTKTDYLYIIISALRTLAHVIWTADTNEPSTVPQAAGLLAMSVRFSRMYRDDQAQLEATMPIYDALYRWARDGQNETHLWPFEV